ncbi:YcjX family protein [Sodalis sp.]
MWRYIKEVGTLYLEIVDYCEKWLLDLPTMEQEYFTWSR